ncbi:MAG: hypothetical protein GY716_17685 [bacterium]|nr:hypothetical protein [bacterium]
MKRPLQLVLCAAACLALAACSSGVRRETPRTTPPTDDRPGKEPAGNWFMAQRTDSRGEHPIHARSLAIATAKDEGRLQAAGVGAWTPAGPRNIGGRIISLALDPNDSDHVWLGAADGGVWHTFNAGASWTPVFDEQTILSIGSIATHPTDSDIVYVATGEDGAGSYAYPGEGVFKTVDGGATWTNLGLAEVRRIPKLAIDPVDPQRIFVAAGGGYWSNDQNRGVYRSTDGGASWQKVLYVNTETGAADVAIDPSNPNIVFAAMWQRTRADNHNHYGGVNSGIWRSLDGGTTWTRLTLGLPGGSLGRIGIAIAPSKPKTVYATIVASDGSLEGIYRSGDSGGAWVKTDTPSMTGSFSPFGYYFGQVRVHPTDESTIYVLDIQLWRSTDAGVTFQAITGGIHVDQHALIVGATGRLLAGNDGGFYRSFDDGGVWAADVSLPITQFYDLCIDAQQPQRRFGGTQDNGTLRTTTAGLDDWANVLGGDGMQCEVDPTDSNRVYAEWQWGGVNRSTNGGASFVQASSGIDPGEPNNWVTPITVDPVTPNRIYTGTSRLYRSTDFAVSWSPVSDELGTVPAKHAAAPEGPPGEDHGQEPIQGTLTAIGVSPVDHTIVWAGTDDGSLWVTDDDAQTWTEVTPPGDAFWVTDIVPDPFDADAAYLSVAGYRSGDTLPYVRYTEDLGATWNDLSATLPQVPVNSVVPDPAWRGQLFAGSDVGVHWSADGGSNWSVLRSGMPWVVVQDLVLNDLSRTLFAGTHGRSMYAFDLGQLPPADGDGDGVDNNADCALADPGAFAVPPEVAALAVAAAPGKAAVISWDSLASAAGPATVYDVATGTLVDLRSSGTTTGAALQCGVGPTETTDPGALAPGSGVWYLARGINACGSGGWGFAVDGPREVAACP